MDRMVNRENEAHPEKKVKRDLRVLDSKAPEDHQDHLVRKKPSSSELINWTLQDLLPP